jgi:hypothetical protein
MRHYSDPRGQAAPPMDALRMALAMMSLDDPP